MPNKNKKRMKQLTEIQRLTLKFIKDFIKSKQYPPTITEIGQYFEITTGTVQDRLSQLERKGFIKRVPIISRGIILNKTKKCNTSS